MQCDPMKYSSLIEGAIYEELNIDKDMATDIVALMEQVFESHLPCSQCGDVLPLNKFSKSKTFTNRQGRFTMCKTCYSEYYRKRKEQLGG